MKMFEKLLVYGLKVFRANLAALVEITGDLIGLLENREAYKGE